MVTEEPANPERDALEVASPVKWPGFADLPVRVPATADRRLSVCTELVRVGMDETQRVAVLMRRGRQRATRVPVVERHRRRITRHEAAVGPARLLEAVALVVAVDEHEHVVRAGGRVLCDP